MTIRVKRVSKKNFEDTIEDFRIEGYSLENEGTNSAVMVKRGGWGRWYWHLILLCLVPIIGNFIYAVWAYHSNNDTVEIKVRK